VKRSKVNLQGAGHIVTASRTACYINYYYYWRYFFIYPFGVIIISGNWLHVYLSEFT